MTYAEVALKGRNRSDFRRRLVDNIRWRLESLDIHWKVAFNHDRVHVTVPEHEHEHEHARMAEITTEIAAIPGVAKVAPTRFYPRENTAWAPEPDLGFVHDEVLGMARHYQEEADEAFRIRVKRADKRLPLSSSSLERELGARVLAETPWQHVSLNHPRRVFYVSFYPEGTYIFAEQHKGVGGLPVGSGGRVMTLLSGGLDSPVAAWMMAKRGCSVDFVHFTATHLQQQEALDNKVAQLARILSRTTLRSRVYLLPYTHFDLALLGNPTEYGLVLFRRFIARCAEHLARECGAAALVNGDSLGQVASQTLDNMVTNSEAVDMPILRPLIGLDKNEIVEIARRIGTFDLSIEPYKDCCALIDREPRTRSRADHINRIEQQALPNYDELIQTTLDDAVRLDFDCGQPVAADHPDPLRRRRKG